MLSPWKVIFEFFASWGGTIPRVSLRYTPGYEPLAPLGHSTFQVVLRLMAAVIGCGHRGIEGNQPERLNAEGEARVLLAGG